MNAVLLLPLLAVLRNADVSGTVELASGRGARQAVIFLEGGAKGQPLKDAVVDQKDRTFLPHVSVVTVGTKVAFPNHDTIFHNVFTEYHSDKFDFGVYKRGETKYQTFDRPGVAVLLCSIHPDMSAYVVCVDTPYYTVADSRGKFRIPNVPSGTYKLRVWHESGETLTRQITVGAGGPLDLKTQKG